MISIQQALTQARDKLSSVTDTPMLEAEILLVHVLGKSRSYLRAWPEAELNSEHDSMLRIFVERRASGEPVAYIIGHKEFWSLDFKVNADTLVPRPETELLIETALSLFPNKSQKISFADLGTGCGAIALTLAHERPRWEVCAVDVSESALNVTRDNAQHLGIDNVSFYLGNWFTALPAGKFDLVVSNPPYIAEDEWEHYAGSLKFEPRSALTSGADGLDAIREICKVANQYIKSDGYLIIEHGFSQGQAVRDLFADARCRNIRTVTDLSGLERVTVGQL